VHAFRAVVLLLIGLAAVGLGAWLRKEGWGGWATPVLILGALFVVTAALWARNIPQAFHEEDQRLGKGPVEGRPVLTCGCLLIVVGAVAAAIVVFMEHLDLY